MKAIIVINQSEIDSFNESIVPLMLLAGQKMERWVLNCPVNSKTDEMAIITESTGVRREVIEKYLIDNSIQEIEILESDQDWFPVVDIFGGLPK